MHPLDTDFVVSFLTNARRYYHLFGKYGFAEIARGILKHEELAYTALEAAGGLEYALTSNVHVDSVLTKADRNIQNRVRTQGLYAITPEELLKIFKQGRLMLAVLEALCDHKKTHPQEYTKLYEAYYVGDCCF